MLPLPTTFPAVHTWLSPLLPFHTRVQSTEARFHHYKRCHHEGVGVRRAEVGVSAEMPNGVQQRCRWSGGDDLQLGPDEDVRELREETQLGVETNGGKDLSLSSPDGS